jgi:hypothetical protein
MIDKLALPCECAGTCSVALVTSIEGVAEDPHEFYVEFFEHVGRAGLRLQAKAAWRVLRGKDPWTHDVSLSVRQILELRDFIDKTVH